MGNIRDYYRRNYHYSSHRLYLPEGKERATRTCRDCAFYITIVGREDRRKGCAALIPRFAEAVKRVPEEIDILEVLREIGKVGLQDCLAQCGEHLVACGFFHHKRNK